MYQIITSILDTDLYKFTMQQCVLHQYPNAVVRYEFKCRNEDVKLGFLADAIKEQLQAMRSVSLTNDERRYLNSELKFLTPDYIEYLSNVRFNPDDVLVEDKDGELYLTVNGKWSETILWEVPLLAIVNELYFKDATKDLDEEALREEGRSRLSDKIDMIREYPTMVIAEFGTRRRYSRDWQEYVARRLFVTCPQIIGTSNVGLARMIGCKCVGTQAHEYFSAHVGLVDNIRQAQPRALHVWIQEYGSSLGIALTDTFTTRNFFVDFDATLANVFDGVRHDSGDPIPFGESVIAHYQKLGINPMSKSIVFSDGLDIPTTIAIFRHFVGRIGISFGIGTNFSNDLGVTPLNIVIKLMMCNGVEVFKISDSKGKLMGNRELANDLLQMYAEEAIMREGI